MSTTSAGASDERMPAGIPYIVINELAERFCYYGVNAILSIYMVQHLHFPEAQATIWQSMFKFGAYFFPIFGAILSDVFWGKFRTIMTLAVIYCVGCAVIALSHGPAGLAAGLFLMAFGTGGIKPCVSTNVGDQFTTKNQHLITKAFIYFYFAINLGSSISIWMCPIWLQNDGPMVAFGIPAAAMLVATLVFWLGRNRFVVVQPAVSKRRNLGALLYALGFAPVLGLTMIVWNVVRTSGSSLSGFAMPIAVVFLLVLLALLIFLSLRTSLRKVLAPEFVAWLEQSFTGESLWLVLKLAFIYYFFIAVFWSLWEQSNGQTWTLQATSDLMDKHLFSFLHGVPGSILQMICALIVGGASYGVYAALRSLAPRLIAAAVAVPLGAVALYFALPFAPRLPDYELLAGQFTVMNGFFILAMIPAFTSGVYPLWERFFKVTALRKVCVGLFVIAASFLIIAWIEDRIMHGQRVSGWWQVLAYMVLSASEVLISITALEFAYSQAPLKMKSFMMAAMYLFSVSFGQVMTITVNQNMIAPLLASNVEAGPETWVDLPDVSKLQVGQKIDLTGDTGLQMTGDDGKLTLLNGTFLVEQIDADGKRVALMDAVHRKPLVSTGIYKPDGGQVSTYRLVGPMYFLFFAAAAGIVGVLFIFVAGLYREKTHVRQDEPVAGAAQSAP